MWLENLRTKSVLTGTVTLRNLRHYCGIVEIMKDILDRTRSNEKDFHYEWTDFYKKLEKEDKGIPE